MDKKLVVTMNNLKEIFPFIQIVALGDSYWNRGVVFVSPVEFATGKANFRISSLEKGEVQVLMDSASTHLDCRRGYLPVYLVEEGGDAFWNKYHWYRRHRSSVPVDVSRVVVAEGRSGTLEQVEGFFRRSEVNPLLA